MVSQSFLSTALAFSAVSVGAVSITKRITGGEDACEGEFPSVVRLGTHCAGVLLDSTTVLTAKHCADSDSFDAYQNSPVVKAGVVNLADEGVVSEYVKLGPEQKKLTDLAVDQKKAYAPNDIAIVKLVTPIEETKTIKYAKLPKASSDPKVNSTAVAVGWGSQGERDSFRGLVGVDKLSKIVIPVHSRQTCVDFNKKSKFDDAVDTFVCAGGDGKTVCGQDSGGPLYDRETGELIGVASFILRDKNGKFCNKSPAVFVRVASYMDFIRANLGGAGGLPTPDYRWTGRAAAFLLDACPERLLEDTCVAVGLPCGAQNKLDTDGKGFTDATVRFLSECASERFACAGREGPKLDRCIDKVKKCVKEKTETPSSTPQEIRRCYDVVDEDDE